VRAFPNKYAALTPEAPPADSDHGRFFASLPGEGVHEVLVESPEHDRSPSSMTEGEMTCVVRAYARRYAALMAGPAIEYVLVFKNHGEEAGTSLRHLHSQIIATPFVPDDVRRKGSIAETHYRQTGECLLCRTVEEEVRCGARIVHGDEQYVVFHPFASSRFAETWIVPLDHRPSFGRASPGNLARLGRVLSRTMKQLSVAFGDPDFNYILHSCPRACEDTAQAYWHWYLQIVPRVAKAAGVELGTGIHINTGWPEETAEAMRRIRP
jgi:UDPglucose--hexose-1-phosphate uridylyltransferase